MSPADPGFSLSALHVCTVMAALSLAARALSDEYTPFTEEAVQRGLFYEIKPFQSLGENLDNGQGLALADLTGNGCNDIVLMGAPDNRVGFFENDCTGSFTDRSWKTPSPSDRPSPMLPKFQLPRYSGIALADFNGDGLLDIYITRSMNTSTGAVFPSALLRNEGDFNFTDLAALAGVTNMGNGEGASWADYDNDGWLDLYVANRTRLKDQSAGVHRNKLYRNLGTGDRGLGAPSFEDVSVKHGVDDHGVGFIAAFSDINRNGWLDLYLANEKGSFPQFPVNQLWINDRGSFVNACPQSGTCLGLWSMCVAAGDFTGNGYPDFYVTNVAHPAGYNGWNPLLINNGDETFTEMCQQAGVCQVITSWCGIFWDFNNNGWLDLYVCNESQPNNLFANFGPSSWPATKVTQQTQVGGTVNGARSFNAAVGDVTGNGSLDLLLNNNPPSNSPPANVQLFINHEGTKRNWIRYSVVGYDGNVHAIGANIEVTANGLVQWREIYAGGNNYKAQNELVFHFGLGDATVADQIVVNWPGLRGTRTLANYPANRHWTIWPVDMLGDSNGDGEINGFDLLALLGAWGTITPGNERMDMNGDGVINGFDLLALLGMWGPVR